MYGIQTIPHSFSDSIKIVWSKSVWGNNPQLKELQSQYDYFIAGSDQVWNPYYSFVGTDLDFLTFVEE